MQGFHERKSAFEENLWIGRDGNKGMLHRNILRYTISSSLVEAEVPGN